MTSKHSVPFPLYREDRERNDQTDVVNRIDQDGRKRRRVNCGPPGDIFNLAFFIVALGLLTAGYLLPDPRMPGVLALAQGLLTFNTTVHLPGMLSAGLILGALLVAYIPLTHMSHFIAKYFTYHSIRWDDLPASRSAEIRKKFAEYLTLRPTWAARHIGADGTKTWAEIAMTNPTAGVKK